MHTERLDNRTEGHTCRKVETVPNGESKPAGCRTATHCVHQCRLPDACVTADQQRPHVGISSSGLRQRRLNQAVCERELVRSTDWFH